MLNMKILDVPGSTKADIWVTLSKEEELITK